MYFATEHEGIFLLTFPFGKYILVLKGDGDMVTEAKKKANAKYDAGHTTQFMMKLNNSTDKDILEKLDLVENKQGYIKNLIRADISKETENA